MSIKLYLDTSVLGALCDPEPKERLDATVRLLRGIRSGFWSGYVSTLVLEEIERAPIGIREKIASEARRTKLPVIEESVASLALADLYVAARAIPSTYVDDARHIAIATINDVRTIVSWNFRHMVNIERKGKINSVNLREGFPLVDIVSPWEVRHEDA